jgi:CheY-like chemotaxis protein
MAQKILIVDDNRATRDQLAQLLTHEGYETLTASDVPTTMRILAGNAPDLLITDIRLDTYNGLHIIAMAPTPVPAIVLTSFADPVIEADARRFGAEYLVRPVAPAKLLAMIAGMLETAQQRKEFTSTRRSTRKSVMTPISVLVVRDPPARLVDVGEGGARLLVECAAGAEPPSTFTFVLPAAALAIPVDIKWKRRQDDTTWICGVAPRDDSQSQWQALLQYIGSAG